MTDSSSRSGQPTDPPEIDASVPSSARIWNDGLGGEDNDQVDREAGLDATELAGGAPAEMDQLAGLARKP